MTVTAILRKFIPENPQARGLTIPRTPAFRAGALSRAASVTSEVTTFMGGGRPKAPRIRGGNASGKTAFPDPAQWRAGRHFPIGGLAATKSRK